MKKWILVACLALVAPLAAEWKVLGISGSTREDSYNKKLLAQAVEIAKQQGASVTVVDLNDYPMPFYNADLEKNEGMPENAQKLRELMIQSDAIMIASPEYNSSVSAVLKNALDWASRSPDGKSSRAAYKGKKFALMSTSPGKGGGVRGLVHLKAIIEDVGGTVVAQQVSVPDGSNAFDAKGNLKNASTKEALVQEIQALK